jgi:hypothetical protein
MVNRTRRLRRIPMPAIGRCPWVDQMTESMRFNFAARLVAIALSSITMLWLLWRFPTPTCIGSIALLGFLLHCAHFARVVDVAVGPDLNCRKQR